MGLGRRLLIGSAALTASCATPPVPVTTTPSSGGEVAKASPAADQQDIVDRVNAERKKAGLSALFASARLMHAARIQADQMAQSQVVAHTVPGARFPDLNSRLTAVGYDYRTYAENVAWNQANTAAAVTAWMNSSGHRANILNSQFTETGAAMARSAKGEPYWVQVFGTPSGGDAPVDR